MLDVKKFGRFLSGCGFRDFSGVPCSYLAPLINYAINEGRFVMAANEGDAVAIASGISLVNLSLNTRIYEGSGLDSQAVTESTIAKDSKNLHTPQAVSRDDFKSYQARGVGATSSVMTKAKCADSLKSAQETMPAKSYGVVLMQNSGLSNALSPLTSLNHTFGIPILGFVSLRGERNSEGKNTDEPQHELLGVITDKLLAVCEIEYVFLSADFEEAKAQVLKARKVLESNKSFFFIVRDKTFVKEPLVCNPLEASGHLVFSFRHSPHISESDKSLIASTQLQSLTLSSNDCSLNEAINYLSRKSNTPLTFPTRLQALAIIQTIATESKSVLLATTGKCGRELYELGDRPNQLYMVGSMGCVSSLALGIALKSDKKVIAIDGDSALLMRLGSLSTNAYYAKMRDRGNFCHILLDNQSHDSTGGQFNLSPFVDFCVVARACGYKNVWYAQDLTELERVLKGFIDSINGGTWFVYLRIAKGSKDPLGRPKITPQEVAKRLSFFLSGIQEG